MEYFMVGKTSQTNRFKDQNKLLHRPISCTAYANDQMKQITLLSFSEKKKEYKLNPLWDWISFNPALDYYVVFDLM